MHKTNRRSQKVVSKNCRKRSLIVRASAISFLVPNEFASLVFAQCATFGTSWLPSTKQINILTLIEP
jgi:hypothetical protein